MLKTLTLKINMKAITKKLHSHSLPGWVTRRPLVIVSICVLITGVAAPMVRADVFDTQIQNLQTQNAQSQNSFNTLQAQANSYQGVIDQLQAQISALQSQITANQAQQAQLQQQIQQAQTELDQQKQFLGADIKAMYVDGQLTTVEELATSKNLSDFVDSETYRSAVQTKIQSTLAQITKLQNQLTTQKQQVDQLLQDQQAQQAQLDASESQQAQLLAYTQDQQAQYTAQIQANNAQIASLRAQQAAAERAAFGGTSSSGGVITYKGLTDQTMCGGGYNFHCGDTQDGWIDNWGLYNRECVSYAAWFEANQGHYIPYHFFAGVGNANEWEGDLRGSSIAQVIYPPTTANLSGDIVYMPIGVLGHVGAVLYDEGGGWLRVGQYNIYDEGMYSEMDLKVTDNLIFFHFTQ